MPLLSIVMQFGAEARLQLGHAAHLVNKTFEFLTLER